MSAEKNYTEKNLDIIRQIKPVLSLDEAAVYLGCTGQHLSRTRFISAFADAGLLTTVKFGSGKRYLKKELDTVLQKLFTGKIQVMKTPKMYVKIIN